MTAPALLAAVPLLLGVLLGAAVPAVAVASLAALGVAWPAAALGLALRRRLIALIAIAVAFAAAGSALGARASRDVRQPALLTWKRQLLRDGPVRVTGVLREDAVRGASGVSLALRVDQIDGVAVSGGVRVTVAGAMAPQVASEWRAGRRVVLSATLREPLDYRNPGVPSDRARLARQGIALLGSVKSAALVTVMARGGVLSETAAGLRHYVRGVIAAAVGRWHPSSGAVVTAILIGDRSGLDADLERRLQEAGTYHVIAISGGNIALLTALLVVCGRLARLPPRGMALGSIAILAFYGYVAGLAPSVMRATIAAMLYLAARVADHRGGALNAIAVAATIAAALDPLIILDPGFVLSFGATLAIVVAAGRMVSPPAEPSRKRSSAGRRLARRVIRAAALLGAATVCAEIALAPVGARVFGRVSLAGLVLNFAAIPLMSAIQIAGLAAAAVSAASSTVAVAPGFAAHIATVALLRSASLVDIAPWLVLDVPPPAWWLIAAWYVGWGTFLLAPRRRTLAPATAVVVVAGLLMAAGRPATRAVSVPPAPPGWARMVFFDVGQGDATLLQPADGSPWLIDAGGVPGSAFDLGRRVTLPSVWAFGVSDLRALVLTHGDPDHIGGAPPLLRALRPREIWEGIPVPRHEPLHRLREAAARLSLPWLAKRAGESVALGRTRIRLLNPPDPDWERPKVRNDDSIVLEIRIGDVAVVLPGDISRAVEPAVIAKLEPGPLTIVKAPHHGSAGSSSPAFVAALRPAAVIFSAGQRNPFGHPAPATVDRYRAAGAVVFTTADDGAVIVETDGTSAVVWTWIGRRVVHTRSLHAPTGELRQRH